MLTIPVRSDELRGALPTLKEDLLQHSGVVSVSASRHRLTEVDSGRIIRSWDGGEDGDEMLIYYMLFDFDFLDLYAIETVEGLQFSPDYATDEPGTFMINEAATLAFGWEKPLGKRLKVGRVEGTEVRVVKDFNYETYHSSVQPMVLDIEPSQMRYLSVRINPYNTRGTFAGIQKAVESRSPYPFEFSFVDEAFDQLYKSEIKLGRLFSIFTLLALVIASLGLFGLAAFTAEQRTRELGVRKVLGASVSGLIALQSGAFTRLVAVAFTIAAPIAWFAMDDWLDSFAYSVEINPLLFAMTFVGVLSIALLSVGYQAFRAASVNPVQSLKYE